MPGTLPEAKRLAYEEYGGAPTGHEIAIYDTESFDLLSTKTVEEKGWEDYQDI